MVLLLPIEGQKFGLEVKEFKLKVTSALLSVDWSDDSSTIIVVSEAYEILFYNLAQQKMVFAKDVKEIEWDTWTAKLGFPVMGVYEGTDFSCVKSVNRGRKKTMIATGNTN